MLRFAGKLTEAPGLVGKTEVAALAEQGWNEREIWEITALTSFFNFSGRMEAASGLPADEIPAGTDFAEGRAAGKRS